MDFKKKFSKEFLWIAFILFVVITNIMAPVVAYLVFQIRALIKLRGGRRIFAAVPLLFMIPIFVVSIEALRKGSNLWPIFLILASPVGCVWLLIAFKYGNNAKQPEPDA
jgi:uncharacterized protein YebE (UPF0316 family)